LGHNEKYMPPIKSMTITIVRKFHMPFEEVFLLTSSFLSSVNLIVFGTSVNFFLMKSDPHITLFELQLEE
jgi:hypothetical protein